MDSWRNHMADSAQTWVLQWYAKILQEGSRRHTPNSFNGHHNYSLDMIIMKKSKWLRTLFQLYYCAYHYYGAFLV